LPRIRGVQKTLRNLKCPQKKATNPRHPGSFAINRIIFQNSFDGPFSAESPNLFRVSTDVCDAFDSFAFAFYQSFIQSHASGLVLKIKASAKRNHSAEIPL
jgi:hypothetical protein